MLPCSQHPLAHVGPLLITPPGSQHPLTVTHRTTLHSHPIPAAATTAATITAATTALATIAQPFEVDGLWNETPPLRFTLLQC